MLDVTLTNREKKVLLMRYGNGAPLPTYKDIAREFGVTAIRIKRIEIGLLRKIAAGLS